jgi:hypothetical protein
MKNKDKTSYEE